MGGVHLSCPPVILPFHYGSEKEVSDRISKYKLCTGLENSKERR